MSRSRARHTNSTNVRLGLVRFGVGVAQGISSELAARLAEDLFVSPRRRARPQRENAWLAGAQPLPLIVDTRPIAAWTWGSGPPVLLVHGWEGRGAQLGALVAPLVESGHRVVTFDGPAHGATPGQTMTLMELTATLRAVAEAAGELRAVIAHSFGAAATTVALAAGLGVERVVYVAPALDLGGAFARFTRWARLGPDAVAEFRRRVERRNGARTEAIDGLTLARTMRTPLLVLHDQEDRQVPFREGVALVERWPNARLVPTRGLGHDRILRDDEVVRRIAAWVSGGAIPLSPQEELDRYLFDPRARSAS
jgi:pimeloyl-ACP methyl ester carboxylesterase